MSNCQACKSERVARVNGKVSDCFEAHIGENDHNGYVPSDLGIGHGDYVEFEYCADCGQIQGDFPLLQTEIELGDEDVPSEDGDE